MTAARPQNAFGDDALYVDAGAPGSAVQLVDGNDIVMALNGNGAVVEYVFPRGLVEPPESPAEKVQRLTAELKDAKKALKEKLTGQAPPA